MTKREGAILSAYSGYMFCNWEDFHEYVEEIMERPVLTHELINLDVLEIDKEFIRQLIRLIENTNHISQETFDRLKEIINKI